MIMVEMLFLLLALAAANPWDKYNLSPATRYLSPVSIVGRSGPVFPFTLVSGGYAVLDYGKEVGGFILISVGAVSENTDMGLAYSESTNYASCPSSSVGACQDGPGQMGAGDHSNGGSGPDGVLSRGPLTPNTTYSFSLSQMRGGFRYLNVFVISGGNSSVEVTGVTLEFTPAPLMQVPNAYLNHFYSSDEMLNRIWYACAYTVQMCTIASNQGRQWPPPATGWNNAVLIGSGSSLLVDGAKRDRTVWPGDMGISTSTAFVSVGDTVASTNALNTLYALQKTSAGDTGMLPYVGPEVFCGQPWGVDCGGGGVWASDTYHLWALAGTINLVHYTGDLQWLSQVWKGFKAGMQASINKIGKNGLMVVTATADWQRGGQGGENIAANSIFCHDLWEGVQLAKLMNDTATQQLYNATAQALQMSINAQLWDDARGCFVDNLSSKLCPQDGNSLMLWFNLVTSDRASRIGKYLNSNWVALGSLSPEWTYNGNTAIGTFPGSMEVLGHLSAGQSDLGLDLIRRQWGYMLNNTNSTQSTFWEGYQANGQYAFDGIYMSHAHGWATGPAPALTFYVVGLQSFATHFRFVPQFASSLDFCEGSLALGNRGSVKASWSRKGSIVEAIIDTSNTTVRGECGLPLSSGKDVWFNGQVIWSKGELSYFGRSLMCRVAEERLWLAIHSSGQYKFKMEME